MMYLSLVRSRSSTKRISLSLIVDRARSEGISYVFLTHSFMPMKKELQNIEDMILKLLEESKGNVLDDVVLIETLAKAKQTSAEIKTKVAESEMTEKQIDETREQYRPVAYRGSLL